MINYAEKCIVTDRDGNHYKLDSSNNLVRTPHKSEITVFSLKEAQERFGTGRKSKFYIIMLLVELQEQREINMNSMKSFFDPLDFDWEELLRVMSYISDFRDAHQKELSEKLHVVEGEITDLIHYIEFKDLSDDEMILVATKLKERQCYRRQVKNVMRITSTMKDAFLDSTFADGVDECLYEVEKIKNLKYAPRQLYDLFLTQEISA